MSTVQSGSGEKSGSNADLDSGLPQMPEVVALDDAAEAVVQTVVADFSARVAGRVTISPDAKVLEGRQLGIVDGHIVLFRENELSTVDDDFLLMGLVAGRDSEAYPLSNPQRLAGPGMELFGLVQARLNAEGIDLSYADGGATITIDAPEGREQRARAVQALRQELAQAAEHGPVVVQWPRQGGLNERTHQRGLKSDVLRISLDDQTGVLTVERNPHKRLSVVDFDMAYRIESTEHDEVARLMGLQRDGTVLSEAEQALVSTSRTREASARRALMLALHEQLSTVEAPPVSEERLRELEDRFSEYPDAFSDPLQTLLLGTEIEVIRQETTQSGAWIYADDTIREALHDEHAFAKLLSQYEPGAAREVLRTLVRMTQYYASARVPAFTWGVQGTSAPKQPSAAAPPSERSGQGSRGPGLAELLGIPASVLPSSVLGVSYALGTRQSGQVYLLGEQPHRPDSTFVYGTTDFANPVELIMTGVGASAGGRQAEGMYFADSGAHTVGSYVERILAPTIIALYNLDEATAQRLLERAHMFDDVFDVDLVTFVSTLDCPELTQHLRAVESVVGAQSTFAGLYAALNRTLADRIGVHYEDANDLLARSGMTVGELEQHIATVGQSGSEAYQQLEAKLRAAGIKEDRVRGMMQSLFGSAGAWDEGTRKFLRTNREGEARVDLSSLSPDTQLADLRSMGITLGGNAWGVLMRVLDYGRPNTVIGDKNTAQGGNYATSILGAENAQICLSPIVRVVPEGNSGAKGDGLDITAYILNPRLVDVVATALVDHDPNVMGGQAKLVVEVASRGVWLHGRQSVVRTVEVTREPTSGGNRQRIAIGLL